MGVKVDGVPVIGGIPGPGVPKGGSNGQILVKNGAENYHTKWENQDKSGWLPAGGETRQMLVKSGDANYQSEWADQPIVSNPNLLDNWYFIGGGSQQGGGQFPINQRGDTKYTGTVYTIDRWYSSNFRGIITLTDEGIKLETNKEGVSFIRQQITQSFPINTTLTISFLVKGTAHCDIGLTFCDIDGQNEYAQEKYYTSFSPSEYWTLVSFTSTTTAETIGKYPLLFVRNNNNPNDGYIYIKAAKLELGDNQTLAHKEGDTWALNDPAPNYAMELAKCQRYFLRIKGSATATRLTTGYCTTKTGAVFQIQTPAPMRKVPTISYSNLGDIQIWVKGTTTIKPSSLTINSLTPSTIDCSVTHNGDIEDIIGSVAVLRIINAGYIDFDSNL